MSILNKLAELIIKKPDVRENIISANGQKLRDILPPVGQSTQFQPVDAPKPSWMNNLPPIGITNDPEISSGMRGSLPVNPVNAPVAQPPVLLPEIPINAGRGVTNGSISDSILPPIDGGVAPPTLKNMTGLGQAQSRVSELTNEKAVDNDKGWKRRLLRTLGEAAFGAGQAVQSNPNGGLGNILGGAIGGGLGYQINPAIDEQRDLERRRNEALQNLQIKTGINNSNLETRAKNAQIANAEALPEFRQGQQDLAKTKEENRQLETTNRYNLAQKNYERLLNSETNKAKQAASKYDIQNIDGYLYRVYKNDPSKEPEAIVDPRTGKQAFNPADVAQEITFEDGTKAYAKGGQIVSGKFSADRQQKQNVFTAEENEKNRQSREKISQQQIGLAQERIAQAKQNFDLSLKRFEETNKRAATASERADLAAKANLIKLRTYIDANVFDEDQKNSLLNGLPQY